MAIYLKCPELVGDVTADGFQKTIELSSLQVGAGVAVESAVGKAGNRSASNPSISEITISKQYDNTSGIIFKNLCTGTAIPKMEIFFVKSMKGANFAYLTITLEDVFFSGQSISSGGDLPSESVSLNFTKINFNYMKNDAEGVSAQGTIAGWDLSANKDAA